MSRGGDFKADYPNLRIAKIGKATVYSMYFQSVSAVELFLSSNPPVNTEVFVTMKSKTVSADFAGEPLPQAIRYCVGGYEEHYDEFLEMIHSLEVVNRQKELVRRTETSFVGSRPNVPAFIAGAPKTMYRTQRVVEKKSVNVFMNLAYGSKTTEQQIQSRGIITLNLIRLLERNGYIVNFRVFEACSVYNEMFLCEVVLKRPGEKMDPRRCYYPMCGKAFLRRIMTRIKESMPFEENWHQGYGRICDEQLTRRLCQIGDRDLYIGTPQELGIIGDNLFQDADNFMAKLNLSEYMKVPNYSLDSVVKAQKFSSSES